LGRPNPRIWFSAAAAGDLGALHRLFLLAQRPKCNGVSWEVTLQQEVNVLGRDVLVGEAEEYPFRLEIADQEQAMETLDRPLAPVRQGTLGLGHGEELGALEVVEIGQVVKRKALVHFDI